MMAPHSTHSRQRAHNLQERDRGNALNAVRLLFEDAVNETDISPVHRLRADVLVLEADAAQRREGIASVTARFELEYRPDVPYHGEIVLTATPLEGEPYTLARFEDEGREGEQPVALLWPSDGWLAAQVDRALGACLWPYPGVARDAEMIDSSDLAAEDEVEADGDEAGEGGVN